MLYGSDLHRVFHSWWEHAKELYGLGAIRGKATDRSTLYYDPLVAYHHVTKAGGHLLLAHELIGQKPAEARLLYDGAAAFLGWRNLEPIQEAVLDYTTLKGEPSGTIRGLTLAREFGDDAVYAQSEGVRRGQLRARLGHGERRVHLGFRVERVVPARAI